jgi:hypothetical protein
MNHLPIDPRVCIGHVQLKIADLSTARWNFTAVGWASNGGNASAHRPPSYRRAVIMITSD